MILSNFYKNGVFSCPKGYELISSKIGANCFIVKKDKIFYMYNFCTCFWSMVVKNWAGGFVETQSLNFDMFDFAKTYTMTENKKRLGDPFKSIHIPQFAEPRFLPKRID